MQSGKKVLSQGGMRMRSDERALFDVSQGWHPAAGQRVYVSEFRQ